MNPALIVRLRPAGPWRSGPDSGARHRTDPIYHSDSLYGAVTSALAALGMRDEWLEATARGGEGPAVWFSSCFPLLGDLLYVVPPRSLWPPAGGALGAGRARWKSAQFIPLKLVPALVERQPLEETQWAVDGASECLVPAGRSGPFRASIRSSAAVDRLTGATERHTRACLEFRPDGGLWTTVSFAGEQARARWSEPVQAAFRWLADSGFGGGRSRGWGRAGQPEFQEGILPEMILPRATPAAPAVPEPAAAESAETEAAREVVEPVAAPAPTQTAHWLLSLFTPAPDDAIDWKQGDYCVVERGGRVESTAGYGARKKQLQMVAEGSVIVAGDRIRGAATDVSPDGFAHPVFRAGFALAIPLPGQAA
jgi:CRISPR type III-A-associated RAMP protein Csm4